MHDKRVLITGSTSGVGREVAVRLAGLGAQVALACRDRGRAEEVATEINEATGGRRATVMTVDTSDQRSIGAFTAEYHSTYGPLDVLVNNAGVIVPQRRMSPDRIELTFATNVVGYYLVATQLRDALEAGAPGRIVNVASTWGHALDLEDLQFERRPYDGLSAYAQSKACDRLLTWALARRLPPESVTVNAVAPGLVLGTSLYRDLTADAKRELEQYGSRSVWQGAETIVWLASSTALDGVTGKFFEQCAEIPCEFRDAVAEERLWATCGELTKQLVAQR
ncbi:MAG: SDR family NAD(P)-dependent oxidoreductase [Candidatus Dormibacteria bacterium]